MHPFTEMANSPHLTKAICLRSCVNYVHRAGAKTAAVYLNDTILQGATIPVDQIVSAIEFDNAS